MHLAHELDPTLIDLMRVMRRLNLLEGLTLLAEVKPSAQDAQRHSELSVGLVASVDLAEAWPQPGDPARLEEMVWIEENASYLHRNNGTDGIWDFVLNLARQFDDVPEVLQTRIDDARLNSADYLIVHLGS